MTSPITYRGKLIRYPEFETDITTLTHSVIEAMNASDPTASAQEKLEYLLTVFSKVIEATAVYATHNTKMN